MYPRSFMAFDSMQIDVVYKHCINVLCFYAYKDCVPYFFNGYSYNNVVGVCKKVFVNMNCGKEINGVLQIYCKKISIILLKFRG